MFKYTRESINLLLEDIKKYMKIFKYGSLIFTTIYFIYALINQTGIFEVNIILASLFVIYSLFEIATHKVDIKITKKVVKRVYNWIKLALKAFTLGSMLYSIYISTTNVSAISTIIATLMIILWVLQFLLEIVVEVVENKVELILEAIGEDWNNFKSTITKPITVVTNSIKKLKGEEIEPEPEKSKNIKKLDMRIKKKKNLNKNN